MKNVQDKLLSVKKNHKAIHTNDPISVKTNINTLRTNRKHIRRAEVKKMRDKDFTVTPSEIRGQRVGKKAWPFNYALPSCLAIFTRMHDIHNFSVTLLLILHLL